MLQINAVNSASRTTAALPAFSAALNVAVQCSKMVQPYGRASRCTRSRSAGWFESNSLVMSVAPGMLVARTQPRLVSVALKIALQSYRCTATTCRSWKETQVAIPPPRNAGRLVAIIQPNDRRCTRDSHSGRGSQSATSGFLLRSYGYQNSSLHRHIYF
jgi:hypothetical protein